MPDPLSGCPRTTDGIRCGGLLEYNRDRYGEYLSCLRCGNEIQNQQPDTLPLTDQAKRERPHRPPMRGGQAL